MIAGIAAMAMTMFGAIEHAAAQGTCAGACGVIDDDCSCDAECGEFGVCCPDFCTECPDTAPGFCGGCCVGSTCELKTSAQCGAAGGSWLGNFTTCAGSPCSPPPPACGDAGTGDCCGKAGTGTPFCENGSCCDAVCACDPFCCNTEWDSFCAGTGFGGGGCGAQNFPAECGCEAPPPPPSCGQPGTGDCCTATGSTHCEDEACCDCICACDPFCCATEWDSLCAGGGLGGCGASNPTGPCTAECSQCLPPPPPTLAVNPNPTVCYQVGDTVSVIVEMQNMVDVVVGGQFFLSYDASVLQFVSAEPGSPPSPFTLEIFEMHVPGMLIYATGVDAPAGGPPFGTDGDAVMAKLTFTSLLDDVCAVSDLVAFELGTKLSDEFGQEVAPLDLADLPAITVDSTDPVLNTPTDVVQECDTMDRFGAGGSCPGACGAFVFGAPCQCDSACVTFGDCCPGVCSDCPAVSHCGGMASATDNCDPDPEVTWTDVIVPGACPQSFTVLREWTATDCSDNSTSHVQAISIVDTTPPVVSPGSVPANMVVYSDAGAPGCGAVVSWTPPTATDNCTATGDIDVVSTHNPGDFFGVGLHLVEYTFTDECGNPTTVSFDVEVLGVSRFFVDVEAIGLEPDVFSPGTVPVERCITFEFSGGDFATVDATLTFLGSATGTVMIEIPCGDYDCVLARDELHTLASADVAAIVGTDYEADFTGANGLVGGDLNDDNVVDILDFGVFVWQFAVNYGTGDTDCLTPYPHADISGDGLVDSADFGFIQQNFLEAGAVGCTAPLLAGRTRGLERITVAELRRRGLGHLAIADLNGDGIIDQQDIVLWLSGVKP